MVRLQNVKAITVSWTKDGSLGGNLESKQRVPIQILFLLLFVQAFLRAVLLEQTLLADEAVLLEFLSLSASTGSSHRPLRSTRDFWRGKRPISCPPSMKLNRRPCDFIYFWGVIFLNNIIVVAKFLCGGLFSKK